MAYIIKRLTDGDTTIDLGRRGENRALAIDFPIDNFIANYGDGMASLGYIRPGDTEPYICGTEVVISEDATYLRWVVTDTDTAKAGSGRCELRWNVDDTGDGDPIDDYDTRAKSIIYTTTVHPSLTDETQIPDPYKDWYDTMMAALAPAIDAADSPALQLLNGGTRIPIGTTKDLNNFLYITEGVYYSDGTVELTNSPVTTPFVMLVREQQAATSSAEGYTSYLITRILITAGGTPKIWVQGGELFRPFTRPPIFGSWSKMPGASNLGYITNLSDVPIGSNGYVRFNAAISPTGALDNFSYWCTGSDNRRSIIAVYNNDTTAKVYINTMYDPAQTTWKGWERINACETEYTSLACAYGTLTYKCYKTGRIVSLIATVEVTSDVPARADLVSGLPYTNTTGTLNYTPIIAFDNTTGEHPIFELHRTNNNTDCSLSCRTAITTGASIRINTIYVTA